MAVSFFRKSQPVHLSDFGSKRQKWRFSMAFGGQGVISGAKGKSAVSKKIGTGGGSVIVIIMPGVVIFFTLLETLGLMNDDG